MHPCGPVHVKCVAVTRTVGPVICCPGKTDPRELIKVDVKHRRSARSGGLTHTHFPERSPSYRSQAKCYPPLHVHRHSLYPMVTVEF